MPCASTPRRSATLRRPTTQFSKYEKAELRHTSRAFVLDFLRQSDYPEKTMPRLFLCIAVLAAAFPAQAGEKTFSLTGKILQADEKPFPKQVVPVVFLQGAVTPFSVRTEANVDGKFRFKRLPKGLYLLVAAVPQSGEVRKSVEVGPSSADAKGEVSVLIMFDENAIVERDHAVSAAELSVSERAWKQYAKAQERLGSGDLPGAIGFLKRAVEIAPQFALAWNQLGTIAYQTKRYGEAEQYFREALKRDERAYSPLVNLGGTLLTRNRPKEALPLNLRAVQAKPDDALAQVQLGRNYFMLGQLDAAEEHLREAKTLDPAHFAYPQLTLMEIYGTRGDVPSVVRELEEFLRLHPDSPFAPAMRRSLEANRLRLNAR